jgi:hypothetical protein
VPHLNPCLKARVSKDSGSGGSGKLRTLPQKSLCRLDGRHPSALLVVPAGSAWPMHPLPTLPLPGLRWLRQMRQLHREGKSGVRGGWAAVVVPTGE